MARPHPALIELAAGRKATSIPDDDAFIVSAIDHRLAGFASWAASQGLLQMDSSARHELAAIQLATTAHNAEVELVAAAVMRQLRSLGWEAAIFKGVATELRWYPEVGTRPAGDVDLILEPAGASAINDILDSVAPDHRLAGSAQQLFDAGRIQSIDFAANDVWVDLHVDPIKIGLPLPGMAELWRRAVPLAIAGTESLALDAETSLLQAAIHLQKDRFSQLYGFVDVARIAASPEFDWDWVQQYAGLLGLHTHLNEVLRVVSETLRIDLPYDRTVRSLTWRSIWPERTRLRGRVGLTRKVRSHYWIPMTIGGRRLEAARWWSRIVVPPAEIVDYMHPDTAGPYPWRVAQYRVRLARDRHRRNKVQRRTRAL